MLFVKVGDTGNKNNASLLKYADEVLYLESLGHRSYGHTSYGL